MLCQWKSQKVLELNVQEDHLHLVVSIPPKLSISRVMAVFEGKDSDKAVQELSQFKEEALLGNHFWAKGYFVNTVGLDEEMVRKYVIHQEKEERWVEDQQ